MSQPFFYNSPILPPGFCFPESFLALAHSGKIPNLQPWSFLFLSMPTSLSYYGAMLEKYPERPLVPFAIIADQSGFYNDGYAVLACFDGDDKSGDPRIFYHDYANPKRLPWSERYSVANFAEWMIVAEEDSARYMAERGDDEGE